MKEFRVYQYMNNEPVAVKMGFNWPSLFFTWLWALVKGCWPAFWLQLGTIAGFTVAGALAGAIASEGLVLLSAVSQIIVTIWYSTFMNDWRAASLEKRGYRLIQTVEAHSRSDAIARVWQAAGVPVNHAPSLAT
jgi:hypothetical protein